MFKSKTMEQNNLEGTSHGKVLWHIISRKHGVTFIQLNTVHFKAEVLNKSKPKQTPRKRPKPPQTLLLLVSAKDLESLSIHHGFYKLSLEK